MSTFQTSEITTSRLGLRSNFEVARDIPTRHCGDESLAKSVYDCCQGINEILTSSFKLHDPRKEFVVDPWEAIIVELSLLFRASMIVAKVVSEEQDRAYFIRTNVTDSECRYIRGESSQNGVAVETEPMLPSEDRESLDNFFKIHVSQEPNAINTLPLGGMCKSEDEQLQEINKKIRAEYDGLLSVLNQATSVDEKRQGYYDARLHNPELLEIGQIAVLALYHVHPNTKVKSFIGSIEIYLPIELPSYIPWVDSDLIANLALILSESVNKLRPIDFRSYQKSPTVALAHIPSFREYGKDLDRYMEAVMKRHGFDHMTTESSLPEVFDDLYIQIRQLLELYIDHPRDISIAFVVPERPNSKGESIGRYYFPPRFVKATLDSTDALTQTRVALEVLKASNTSQRIGVPLSLGLFGYMSETGFPVILRRSLENDARTQSYDDELQKNELMLFLRDQDASQLSVIEFPLVLFSDDQRKFVYPSGLIIFLSAAHDALPFRVFHHLYALACDARYTLSKAFAAEVYREDQVSQLSNVVHDIDRMCRPFATEISKISSYIESNASLHEGVGSVNNLKTSALVIQDILQFAQWTANRQSHDRPNETQGLRVETLSDSLNEFQDVFSYIWRSDPSKSKWPGWAKLNVVVSGDHIEDGVPELSFKWPQGALYTILWNLSANAEKKYRLLPDGTLDNIKPSINCRVGEHRRVESKAGRKRWARDATFDLRFPQIDFWDKSLQSSDLKEATTCYYPARTFCIDEAIAGQSCDHLRDCGPYRHATIFNSENAPTGKRGLKSCRQALDEWFSLMDLEPEQSPIQTVKAGLPVLITFTAPLFEA